MSIAQSGLPTVDAQEAWDNEIEHRLLELGNGKVKDVPFQELKWEIGLLISAVHGRRSALNRPRVPNFELRWPITARCSRSSSAANLLWLQYATDQVLRFRHSYRAPPETVVPLIPTQDEAPRTAARRAG